MNKRFYTVSEIAEYLGLSVSTVRKWIRTGQIPYCRMNSAIRFDIKKIDEWTENNNRTYSHL